ncbi:hypothetical protein PY650_18300 [Rhizobium calliandrae]|uniref:Uncharacterized protein n=1 Tax=Rhizobium calliandrae TaxID=1312182 RepID=A0ABT7KHC5_9HYPH|nr:hypothetical protein [Rhizobium calliandrae]MDL2407582.1 hypothetical protein [Rhizobium calliandrae]
MQGGLWDVVGTFNDNFGNFGFAVVGIFIASGIVSTVVYRVKGYDHLQANI